jgi:hypothetical protein
MAMTVGSADSPLTAAASAAPDGNRVQGAMAVAVLKKAQQIDAEAVKLLIASATGIGQRLDVTG